MFFQNLSKRKILLLIINSLISILLISCVIFLYLYLPASPHASTFTVEKENSIHITNGHYGDTRSAMGNIANANVRISQVRMPSMMDSNHNEPIDETIYIDNENYGDESYDNSGNFANGQIGGERPNEYSDAVTAPVTIIERPIESSENDFYYDNYDYESETDDEDIVSSGDGKIVVNVKKSLHNRIAQQQPFVFNKQQHQQKPEPINYIENVYSVSSEIVSNLKSQYSVEDTKQINKPDKSSLDADTADSDDDEWTDTKNKRLMGNNRSLVERSKQLLLCESAQSGELCRMLFKDSVGYAN